MTRSQAFLLVLFILLIGISLWINTNISRPSINQINNWRSSAFHGRDVPDPLQLPQSEDSATFTNQYHLSQSVPPGAEGVTVSFLYQCQPACHQLWLHIHNPLSQPEQIKALVHHSVFDPLPWFHIKEGELYLYQKTPTYTSITELLNQLPQKIVTESSLAELKNWQGHNFDYLENTASLENHEYFISTRRPLEKLHTWNKYETNLVLQGLVDQDQKLGLTLTASESTQQVDIANIKFKWH